MSKSDLCMQELDVSTELLELITYLSGQWIQSQTFPVTSWSDFQRPFRTNSDVEGWHHKLNQQANGAALNMYDLITRLHEEAKDVELLCHFLEEEQIRRVQRKTRKKAVSYRHSRKALKMLQSHGFGLPDRLFSEIIHGYVFGVKESNGTYIIVKISISIAWPWNSRSLPLFMAVEPLRDLHLQGHGVAP